MFSADLTVRRQPTINNIGTDGGNGQNEEWRIGVLCDLFSIETRQWIEGQIVNLFSDDLGDWMRVQYGQRIRDILRDDPFVRMKRTDSVNDERTWFNVLQCVTNELFPVLSVKLSECVQDKLVNDPSFKINNLRDVAVEDVLKRLMTKRTMNNKEIDYLKALIQRAHQSSKLMDVHEPQQRLVNTLFFEFRS